MALGFSTRWFGIGLTLAALGLPVSPAAAQDQPKDPKDTPARRPEGQPGQGAQARIADVTARFKAALADLKLTDDQKAKADEILAKAQEKAQELRKELADNPGREAFRKLMDLARSTSEEISGLLNDEQRAAFQKKVEEARAALGVGRGGAAGAPVSPTERIKKATADLGLTDDQKKKVDEVAADMEKKAREIMAGPRGPETREKLQALREEGARRMKEVLNEEQYRKFEQAMQSAAAAGGQAGGQIAQMLRNVYEATRDLNLSDDQKQRVEDTFATARKKFEELRSQGGNAGADLREKVRQIMDDLRADLTQILTPEQQERLRAALQLQGGGARPSPERKPENKPGADKQ